MSLAETVISAIGMTTPVGINAAQSCAAIRASISAMSELDFTIETDALDQVPIMGCSLGELTAGYVGLGRYTRLAVAALKDLLANARLSAGELDQTALYLAIPPAARSGVDSRLPSLLASRIAQWSGLERIERRARVCAEGHAAAARACEIAIEDLTRRAVDRVIICGVDSLIEHDTLRFFLAKGRLKTEDCVNGFVPGEAAACILLERASVARARGAPALAVIDAASTAIEPVTIWSHEPSAAIGLSNAVQGTLNHLGAWGPATVMVSDLNGEVYRAKEFGTAVTRVLSAIPGKWDVWHPADCIGDTGAAAFVISACVSARALARGYAKANRAFVLGSSDDGLRGAMAISRAMEM
jgi:3-oxoacyl-[acyl-carrier-protein] synthase-1